MNQLVRRLFALGVLQLALTIATAIAILALTRPARPPFPPRFPESGSPPSDSFVPFLPPPHHHLVDPHLYPPLLTFVCGLVIVGLGAWLTAGWFRRLLLAEKELLANVSHELRTPLARIRVALDLADEGDAETARHSLAEIETDLQELETLVEQVLAAARLELTGEGTGGGFDLHPVRVDAREMVEQASQRFRSAFPRTLNVSIAPSAGVIEVDRALFRRVLDNLLENAHKYSRDQFAPVELALVRDRQRVVFEVRDRGMGIPPDDLPHVFAPFFRGERSRDRQSGGVGLGLTLARRVVEAHRGTIALESQPGTGTVARVSLPLAR